MKTDIWMPLYINDYLADTMELKAEGHGIYVMLMFHYWKKEKLPQSKSILMDISRTNNAELLDYILDEYFDKTASGYTQKRLCEEKNRANHNRDKARENGKKGGRPKTERKPTGYDPVNLSGNLNESSSSSSSPIPTQSTTEEKEPPNPQRGKRFNPDLDFIESDEWRALYYEWVSNKKSKYTKQIGVEKGYTSLLNISNNSIETARAIIDKSLANNWAGLFPIDNNSTGKKKEFNIEDYEGGTF